MTTPHDQGWPNAWPRTPPHKRVDVKVDPRTTFDKSKAKLLQELKLLGTSEVRIWTALTPHESPVQPVPEPGVAVWFAHDADHYCVATDRYWTVAANLKTIRQIVTGLRTVERHGGADLLARALAGFETVVPESKTYVKVVGEPWHKVLEVPMFASVEDIKKAYKKQVVTAHPDHTGGSHEKFVRVNAAYEEAMSARGVK